MQRLLLLSCFLILLLTGCEAPLVLQSPQDKAAINAAISGEKPGDYFIGRRFYKVDYKMWGWVKNPGESWKQSRLVMLNEQKKLAPDRERNNVGSDNNYEYRLIGHFSGEKVYEPASDTFYPEFILSSATVISTNPPLIFPDKRWINPSVRLINPPQY
ncbi:MAG: hypothetical protein WCP41_05375 [Verrucomicrobiota bacterium]|jgi:hypothetical protein